MSILRNREAIFVCALACYQYAGILLFILQPEIQLLNVFQLRGTAKKF